MATNLEQLLAANEALKREIAEGIIALERTEAIARISEENPDPVMRVTGDCHVVYANRPAMDLLHLWEIEPGDRLPAAWCQMVTAAIRERRMIEEDLECGDKIYALMIQSVAGGEYVNMFGRDITKRKETEDQIVNYDDLTGLPNRALFQDRLKQVLSHARRVGKLAAVHLVDLDHFKEINETMGHEAGDALLKGVSERVAAVIRTSDTVARLGGDEFAVIQVEPNDSDGVAVLAQKLLDCLQPPFHVNGQEVHSGASIGITVYPNDASNPDEMLRNADLALYAGKGEGRGTYRFFVAKMNDDIQNRRQLEADMRAGIERGEFLLHYQPKLHLESDRVTGYEALIRWLHPERGFLSPAEFIPVAERSKLIVPLGEWALREACRQAKAWSDAGLGDGKVAVNLSAVQLNEVALTAVIKKALDETGLKASQLELEITESLAMNNPETTVGLFKDLAKLGLTISIDDFGTGYSSLAYLKNFPVQRIKIDKAFVDDIGDGAKSGAIARAVTTIGHSFGMQITAEGVETEPQLKFLKRLGCDEVQGYYFSRPLPAAETEEFLAAFAAARNGGKARSKPKGAMAARRRGPRVVKPAIQ
jgi:diguanylate cyclase (GGDEF)-like protein